MTAAENPRASGPENPPRNPPNAKNREKIGFSLEHLFWLAGASALILSIYKFQQMLNTPYRLALLATLPGVFLCRNWTRFLLNRYFFLIFLSFFIIGLYVPLGRGDRMGHTFYAFARSIPFFFLGYSIAKNTRWRTWLITAVVFSYTCIAVWDGFRILSSADANALVRQEIAMAMGQEQEEADPSAMLNNIIYHFPTMVLVFVLSFAVYESPSGLLKILIFACQMVLMGSVLFSTMTAAILLLASGIFSILLFRLWARQLKVGEIFLAGLFLISLTIGQQAILSSGERGDSGKMLHRIEGVIQGLSDPLSFGEDADHLSGSRFSLAGQSLDGFLKAPLFGVGDHYDHDFVGGHSFILDSLARYGIVGGIPLIAMLGSWVVAAWNNFRRDKRRRIHACCASFSTVFFLGNFLNPYLFMATLDFLVFWVAGMTCGARGALPAVPPASTPGEPVPENP